MQVFGRQLIQGMTAVGLLLLLLSLLLALSLRFDLQAPQFPHGFLTIHAVPATAPASDRAPTLLEMRFQQGVSMLHARQYEYALVAFHQVIKLSPSMPEAFVNMGYALLGLQRYQEAAGFFEKATEIKPYQGNAYWGLAVALDKLGDIKGAMGAMRTYIHLAPAGDPYVRKARSALWEWDSLLKKGPPSDEEKAWLERRGQEWEDRGTVRKDVPDQGSLKITVEP